MWRHSALESRLVTVTRGSNGKVAKALGFVSPSCENGNHGNTGKHWMHLNAKCDTTSFDPNRVYPLNGLFMVGVLETSISLQYACFKNGSPISNTLQCIMMSYDVLCLFLQIWIHICICVHFDALDSCPNREWVAFDSLLSFASSSSSTKPSAFSPLSSVSFAKPNVHVSRLSIVMLQIL